MVLNSQWRTETLRPAFTDWLGRRLGTPVEVERWSSPKDSGYSNETVIAEVRHGDDRSSLVLRLPPRGQGMLMEYDLEQQFLIMTALHADGRVPVPRPRWLERDPDVLGAPFYVMDRVPGRVPLDDPPWSMSGWVVDLDPADQTRLHDSALGAVVDIHRVDVAALGLDALARPALGATALDQKLEYGRRYREFAVAALGARSPMVDTAYDWLLAHRPTDEPAPVLSWGDPRLGNLIVDDRLGIAAVLDWEFSGIVAREYDVAYWLFAMRYYTQGLGAELPSGFPDHDGTVARYEQLAGVRLHNLRYYEVLVAFISAVNMMRVAQMSIAAGLLSPETTMGVTNSATQILGQLLGLPGYESINFEPFRLGAEG